MVSFDSSLRFRTFSCQRGSGAHGIHPSTKQWLLVEWIQLHKSLSEASFSLQSAEMEQHYVIYLWSCTIMRCKIPLSWGGNRGFHLRASSQPSDMCYVAHSCHLMTLHTCLQMDQMKAHGWTHMSLQHDRLENSYAHAPHLLQNTLMASDRRANNWWLPVESGHWRDIRYNHSGHFDYAFCWTVIGGQHPKVTALIVDDAWAIACMGWQRNSNSVNQLIYWWLSYTAAIINW